MNDGDCGGGLPVLMKALLEAGLMHGDVITVTGKNLAENLAANQIETLDGTVQHTLHNPIHSTAGFPILSCPLAPDGAVLKTAVFDAATFEGPTRVCEPARSA